MKYYCGIDIGKSGYAAVLNEDADIVALIPLDRRKDGRGSDKDFVDPMALVKSIEQKVGHPRSVFFFVEEQFRNKSTLTDFGTVLGAIAVFQGRNPASANNEIHRVSSRKWMHLLGVTSNKSTHIEYVNNYYKENLIENLTHDQADAICLALYGLHIKIAVALLDEVVDEVVDEVENEEE